MNNTFQRDRNLDLIKALAIILVLLWHLQPIRILNTDELNLLTKILKFVLTQFYLQITLVAVPLLFLVSLYLFFQKIEERPLAYFKKRFLRIGSLYIFWTVCQFAVFYLSFYVVLKILTGHTGAGLSLSLPIPIHRLLNEGGPPLAIVGASVFYFLFVLLILVSISICYYALRNTGKIFFSIGAIAVVVSILYFELLNLNGIILPHYRIDNFLIYIPFSYFLLKQERKQIRRIIPIFLMGFVVFSVQDFFLRRNGFSCDLYSRVSIVFGSITMFSSILQLKLKNLKKFSIISLLSKYLLGIFATHKYWYLLVTYFFIYNGLKHPVSVANFPIDLRVLSISIISILLTIFAVWLAGQTFIRRLVS